MSWLKNVNKPDPKYGWCDRIGRNHCLNDQRGVNPGWCVHCKKPWVEKK